MMPCGLPLPQTPSTTADHLFLERLKLLIIMAKAALEGCPIGDARATAIRQNAHFIFHQSHDRFCRAQDADMAGASHSATVLFYQRTQLLALMAQLITEGGLEGRYRKRAVVENIDWICDHLSAQFHWAELPFLKVA